MTEIFRKPKIGVLLIEAERFRGLGEGTARGTYAVRKDAEAAAYIEKIKEFYLLSYLYELVLLVFLYIVELHKSMLPLK